MPTSLGWGGIFATQGRTFTPATPAPPSVPATPGEPVLSLARVYLHDGAGRRIGEVTTARDIDRAYLIMEPASARFTCAVDEPLLADLDPQQGRMVVIESLQYPYPWVGKLTVPSWNRDTGEITVMCRSLDAVLTQRFVSASSFAGAAGAVAKEIIEDAAAQNGTGIAPALNGFTPGPRYESVSLDRSSFQALNLLSTQVGMEWWVEYAVDQTSVAAYAHFRPARGFDRCRQAVLMDGGNADWTECKIDGEATTFGLTIVGGQGSVTQAYEERPRTRQQGAQALNSSPVAPTGLVHGHGIPRTASTASPLTRIERLRIAENLKGSDNVQAAADAMLGRPPLPERSMTWQVLAVDHLGAAVDWTPFDLGSVVRAVAPDAFTNGFDGSVRIVAVQPHEEAGLLNLVVELVGDHA